MVDNLAIDEPPEDVSLDWIWRAWHRLSDDRPRYIGGMGPPVMGRIPWTVVRLWCRHYRLLAGEMTMLDTCLMEMDAVYLEWWAAQQTESDAGSMS